MILGFVILLIVFLLFILKSNSINDGGFQQEVLEEQTRECIDRSANRVTGMTLSLASEVDLRRTYAEEMLEHVSDCIDSPVTLELLFRNSGTRLIAHGPFAIEQGGTVVSIDAVTIERKERIGLLYDLAQKLIWREQNTHEIGYRILGIMDFSLPTERVRASIADEVSSMTVENTANAGENTIFITNLELPYIEISFMPRTILFFGKNARVELEMRLNDINSGFVLNVPFVVEVGAEIYETVCESGDRNIKIMSVEGASVVFECGAYSCLLGEANPVLITSVPSSCKKSRLLLNGEEYEVKSLVDTRG